MTSSLTVLDKFMEELQLTLTPARVDQRNFGVMLSNWRVGQVINALVVDRMPSGNLLLNAGGREFVTPMDLPVQPGTRLQLEVQQVTPQLILKLVPASEKASAQTLSKALDISSSLPRGVDSSVNSGRSTTTIAMLLSTFVSQPGLRSIVGQSPALASVISSLTGQALQPSTLSAGALAQAVTQSGLFAEANLLAGRATTNNANSKSQLIQLQRSAIELMGTSGLRPDARAALSNLSDLTNAALANLNQQQLISMPQENGGQRWAFSLPLEWGGSFSDLQMTIERDAPDESSDYDQPSWKIHLSLELPEIGKLTAILMLIGSEISVVFKSNSPSVRGAFENSLAELKDRMIVNDFRVRELCTMEIDPVKPTEERPSEGFEVRV